MTAVTVTASQISASEERGAIIERYVAGVAISLGQSVYLDSSNNAQLSKADSSAHAQAVGIAAIPDNFDGETVIQAGGTVAVVVYGPVWGFTGLVPGNPLWVDKTTAGSLNTAAPTGAYQFQVGHSIDPETFFVDPGTSSPVSA
jgi:hypothetical protein